MRRLVGGSALGLAALAGAACSSKTAAQDGGPDLGANTDVPEVGALHGTCPTTLPGVATMTRVGWSGGPAFCIDDTEVTNTQYQAFLTAANKPSMTNERCKWNTSLAPSSTGMGCTAFDPAGQPDLPVVCVNWCDADAYCRWAGKYLCGAPDPDGIGGAPVKNPSAPGGSQWIVACSNDGATTYPYGSAGSAGVCVDKKYPSTNPGVQPVKAATLCVGGLPGIFDMAGNASEWQNDCVEAAASTDGKDDECDTYGGARSSDYVDTSCLAAASTADTAAHFTRAQVAPDNGFRCCANAVF